MDSGKRSSAWSIKSSLRAKIALGMVLPLVVILGTFTFIEYLRHREAVFSNLSLLASQSGQVIEDNLRRLMLASDPDKIEETLEVIAQRGTFERILVLDTDGEVIYAPGGRDVGVRLDNHQPECQPCHALPVEERPGSVVVTNDDGVSVFRTMNPIENGPDCVECHDEEERLIGVLLTDIPTDLVEPPLSAHFDENLLWGIGSVLVVVVVANLTISRVVLRRLGKLLGAMSGFGQGQTHSPLAEGDLDEIGQLSREFNIMASSIETRRQENQALSERLYQQSAQRGELLKSLITAQEDERKRVARELHDELGQSLGGLALGAELVEKLMATDPDRALEQLRQIKAMIHETSDRMYDLIVALRPAALDDLGLVPALRSHVEHVLKETDTRFEFDVNDLQHRLPAEVETALFRTTQEAITNIVRHAEATQVKITLACTDGIFRGEIADNGRGFDPDKLLMNGHERRNFGLLGMQERITQCGGNVQIVSRPKQGTRIIIQIPVGETVDE